MTTRLQQRLLCIFAAAGLTVAAGCQGGIGRFMPDVSMPKALARKNGQNSPMQQPGSSTPRVTGRNYAHVQLALGDSLAKEGNFEAAQAAYEAAIRNDDSLARAYHRLALLREKAGDRSDANDLLRKAIALDPKNAEIVCDYGYCCYLRQDWKESQKQFERALQLNPNLKRAHNNLGLVYARTGRADDALRQFSSAGLSPADARANLGFVYLTEKRFQEAKAELQLAAAANPSSVKARDILARFDKIETSAQPQQVPAVSAPKHVQTVSASAPAAQPTIHDHFDVGPLPASEAPGAAVETPRYAVDVPTPAAETQLPVAGTPRVAQAETPRQEPVVSQPAVEVEPQTGEQDLPTQQGAAVLSDYQF